MSRNLVYIFLLTLAVVVGGVYFLGGRTDTSANVPDVAAIGTDEIDSSGPILLINVTGEANGTIEIQLYQNIAPGHVERITELAGDGVYDGVVFHRVIEGFMAQTGDVEFGRLDGDDLARAGMGRSSLPNLAAEFSDLPFARGTVGMARAADPNSANSQFYIMFGPAPHLQGQYTVVGHVVAGLDILDQIKHGEGPNGAVLGEPDVMARVRVIE